MKRPPTRFHPLSDRFSSALLFAADVHHQQQRKKTAVPYIAHIMAVSALALEYGANEDEAIAALLHDAVEDAPKQLGRNGPEIVRRHIGWRFGADVLRIVNACTDAHVRDVKGEKLPWTARKVEYVKGIRHKTASAVLVSAADKLHNARAILRDHRIHSDRVWKRFNKEAGERGTVGYYRGLVRGFQRRAKQLNDGRLRLIVKDLDEVVTALEDAVGFRGVWPPRPAKK